MCRWMARHGQPVLIDELLFKAQHGLIDQRPHSRLGAETTNGDGFGVVWARREPRDLPQRPAGLGRRELTRPVGIVEATGARHDVPFPFQGSIGISDGESPWAVRTRPRAVRAASVVSADVHALRKLHLDDPRIQRRDVATARAFGDDDRRRAPCGVRAS